MSSSVAFRKKSLSMDFLKRTAGLVTSAAGSYMSDAMPTTVPTIVEARSTVKEISSTFANTSQDVLSKTRRLKSLNPIREIYRWYMDKDNEFDDSGFDTELQFDTDVDASAIADVQINEAEKNANKVAKAVVQSSKQMVDAQITSIANLQTTLDKQTAVISAGFDKTNETLNKILEVVTKNSATLIETTVAASNSNNPVNDMMRTGRFNANSFKKMVTSNIKNSTGYSLLSLLPMVMNQGISPDDVVKGLLTFGIDRASPNLKKNLKALDDAVNDTIMHSLIRLGNTARKNPLSFGGMLGSLIGIDSTRKTQSTQRSTFEVKATSFDTITKEAITNAIPGYLRKILVALGGEDMVYDYRSRNFKTKAAVRKEFIQAGITNTNAMYQASSTVRNALDGTRNAKTSGMLYQMLLTQLGAEDDMTGTLESFKDPKALEAYMKKMTKGVRFSKSERQDMDSFMKAIQSLTGKNNGIMDMSMQASKGNVQRNAQMAKYIADADKYNVDLSEFSDSIGNDIEAILAKYGKKPGRKGKGKGASSAAPMNPRRMSGVDYSNAALYQIFRRLDEGINVFQVGQSGEQGAKFDKWGDEHLPPPAMYKPRTVRNAGKGSAMMAAAKGVQRSAEESGPNLLMNQTDEQGNVENLTTGQRVGRWAKGRGKQLQRALWSGSPEEVRGAFADIVNDISGVAGEQFKKGASKINQSFGNVTGHLKHKMFGTEYTYTTVENGKEVTKKVPANEKGGIFGFIKQEVTDSFKATKDKLGTWFGTVKEYFNYGDGDPEEKDVNAKRKKLIFGSVGALAGAGILGGPLGMIVGSLAGTALSSFGFGKKIKNFLFGHDKDGKPTGLLSKAADAIISPIKFQIGKTMALIGGTLKKGILGPLSDIGLAIKDRIHNHVASIFDKIKDTVGGFFKKTFGKLFGFLAKGAAKIATGVGNFMNTTGPGKAIRAGITAVGGVFGGGAGFAANTIAGKRSFHKLKKGDEEYVIKEGQRYIIEKDKKKKILTADHDIDYDEAVKMGAMPSTRDYIKFRKKARKKDVDEDLERSGYYSASSKGALGKIKGFFGGDYKAWHEQELKNRQARRNRFKDQGYGGRESEAITITSESTKETAENTAEIKDATVSLADAVKGEIIPGHSFKSHDQGVHDRLDELISIMRGDKKKSSLDAEKQSDSAFANSLIGAATQAGDEGGYNNEDISDLEGIVSGSQTGESKSTMFSKFKRILSRNKNKGDKGSSETTEKKESLIEKLLGGSSGGLGDILKILAALAGLIPLLIGLFKNGGLGELLDRVGEGLEGFKEMLDGTSDKDPTTVGMNTVTALADAQVNKSWDWANPFADIYHNKEDAAGNQITNTAVTEAKDEVLYKQALRRDLTGGIWNNLRSANRLDRAIELEELANTQQAKGGFFNNLRSRVNRHRSENLLDQAIDAEQAANAPKTNTIKSIGRNLGRIGAINVVSQGLGNAAGGIATSLGASEETAQTIDNVTTAATSGAMTVNMATSAIKPNKKSWVDRIVDGITKMFKWLGDKIGADKAFKKIGSSKIVSTLTKFTSKISSAISSKLDDILIKKITEKLAAVGVKNAAAVASAGIAVAVGGVAGLASGLCGVEHLFGVLPNEADNGMKTIAGVLGAAFGALEMTPVGWVIAIFDVIDAILVSIPGIETGIKQFIARELYKLFGDDEADASLAAKQEAFNQERQYYADTYGVDMNHATFNDMVNTTGFFDRIWNGKVGKGEDGHLNYDDAGAVIKTGGMKGWFVGSEYEYEKDAEGNVLRDAQGNAIKKIDAQGHTVKKDMKWGDHVGNFFHDVGGWFAGKTTYKTDDQGNVLYDENGNPIVESKEKNIFGRAGDAIASGWNSFTTGVGNLWNSGKEAVSNLVNGGKEKAAEIKENITATVSKVWGSATKKVEEVKENITATVSKGWETAKEKVGNAANSVMNFFGIKTDKKEEKKENDKDDDKKVDKKSESSKANLSKITSGIKTIMNPLASIISDPFNSVKSVLDKFKKQENEVDENGEPIKDSDGKVVKKGKLSDVITKGLGKVMSAFTKPVGELIKGAEEWEKSESPFKQAVGGAANWLKNAATGLFSKVSSWFNPDGTTNSNSGIGGPVGANTVQLSDGGGSSSTADQEMTVEGGNPLNKPFKVNSYFGWRDLNDNPADGKEDWHKGIDLAPSTADGTDTDVGARYAGTISKVVSHVTDGYLGKSTDAGGNMVWIKTDDGYTIKNMHLAPNSIPSNIVEGARVNVGDKLGVMGSTGNSSGPHLHYQIDDPNGQELDPLSDVSGGALISSFNSTSAGTHQSYGSTASTAATASAAIAGGGALARFIEALKSMGSALLNKITGGLFGNSGTSSTTDSTLYGSGNYYSTHNYSGYTGSIRNVNDFLAMCEAEVGTTEYKESDGTYNNYCKYNDWYWGDGTPRSGGGHAWCMAFVQWCFNQAGLPLEEKTASCSTLLNWYRNNHPERIVNTPKPGDIVMFKFSHNDRESNHTGIVKEVISSTHVKAIEGNTGKPGNSSEQGVWVKDRSSGIICYIRAVDWDVFASSVGISSISDSGNGEGIYDYLRSIGYTSEGAAGVLGNLYAESGFNPRNLQNSYEDDLGHTDDSYTNAVDSGMYTRTSFKDDSAGYGLAQWTYHSRKAALYDAAKSSGVSIGDLGFQTSFLANELTDYNLDGSVKNASSYDTAARTMMLEYEKPGDQSVTNQNKRVENARQYYNMYRTRPVPTPAAAYGVTDGVGGPIDGRKSRSSISASQRYRRTRFSGSPSSGEELISIRPGIGGPTESTSTDTLRPRHSVVTDNTYQQYTNMGSNIDNDELQRMLVSILTEMRYITQNTGSSSDLLGELNSKEFVDQGLRNSISAASANRSRSVAGATMAASSAGSRTAVSLARPH